MPRRLERPSPELHDESITLEPLSRALVPELGWVQGGDPEIARFTYLPSRPARGFVRAWVGRYESGWEDGSRAGFAVRDGEGSAVGFAAFVRLSLEDGEGEIGYAVAPEARRRGIATRAVALLTAWGFEELDLRRIELRIDPRNTASSRVAKRAGYTRERILRSVAFKEGLRADVGVWSRVHPGRSLVFRS